MTPQSELEITGNLFTRPFAELIGEIGDARLGGSLRLDNKDRKSIVYFKEGRVVFAASNALSARLFQILLDKGRVTKQELGKIPNFSNDLELAAHLEKSNAISKEESSQLFSDQLERIVIDILSWKDAAWTFSSLKRVREGLEFPIDTRRILFDYARCTPVAAVLTRFRSLQERFHRSAASEYGLALTPDEAFVLSRATDEISTVADLLAVSALTEEKVFHVIYTLWLGGLIVRDDWQPAFDRRMISMFKTTKLSLKREAKMPGVVQPAVPDAVPETPGVVDETVEAAPEIPLEEYLARVEAAETHYDVLGVEIKAELSEIRRAYFSIARTFHPDKFHSDDPNTFRRVQDAFASVMQANEALKAPESRDLYDYRMRKELADRAKREAEGRTGQAAVQADQAEESFNRGFTLLMDDDAESAIPFLARAAHFGPKVARYHAYYGKALSSNPELRHKAEQAMQTALRLDPTNPTFRILLAEFFIQFNLLKRAEGELNRLLAVFPSNREAQDLLDSLKAKG